MNLKENWMYRVLVQSRSCETSMRNPSWMQRNIIRPEYYLTIYNHNLYYFINEFIYNLAKICMSKKNVKQLKSLLILNALRGCL